MPQRKITLTSRSVPTLPAVGGLETIYWDRVVSGFYLAVYGPSRRSAQGVRSFGVWYRVAGRARQRRLGRHPAVTLAAARDRAREILEAARVRGIDLGGAPRAQTLEGVVEAFLVAAGRERPSTRAPSTLRLYRQQFDAYVAGERAAVMPLDELRRRDVRDLVAALARRTPVTARRVLQLIRVACRWALREELIPRDPTFGVEKPGAEASRDRVLSDDELAALWRAAEDEGTSIMTAPEKRGAEPRRRQVEEIEGGRQRAALFRLLILTACRTGETAALEWAEIDWAGKLWTIPAEHRKGQRGRRRPQIVPLSTYALAELERLRAVTGAGRRAFPWAAADHKHWADPIARRGRALGVVRPWTPHDLRRTAATGLARLGVSRSTIALVLGHAMREGGAVTGVYDRFDRMPERAAALEAWGAHVAALTRGRRDASG